MKRLLERSPVCLALIATAWIAGGGGCADDAGATLGADAALVSQPPAPDAPAAALEAAPAEVGGTPLGLAACGQLVTRAVETVTAAAMSVVQCHEDADCVRLDLPSPCWRGCDTAALAGNADTRSAVAAKAGEVAAICEAYDRGGCYGADGTDGCFGSRTVGTSFKCEAGQCGYSDPTTCNDLSRAGFTTLQTAAQAVEQCQVDADCQQINVAASCWDSCGLRFAGNQATRDAIAAQAGAVAAICDRFIRAGCVVVASGCPGFPGNQTLHCDARRCVYR